MIAGLPEFSRLLWCGYGVTAANQPAISREKIVFSGHHEFAEIYFIVAT